MFSKNGYMFPHQVSTSSVIDLNGLDLSIHHDVLAGHFLAPVAAVEAASNNNNSSPLYDQSAGDLTAAVSSSRKQAPAKRDRHSKIYTSQGPRDRRVRLSIGIARKFFDLQELLGFDKPSKTLDWLLTKSKTAIKDLMQQTKQTGDGENATSSPSEVESSGNLDIHDSENNSILGKGKAVNNNKPKSVKDPNQVAAMNLARESRVKARARARERTREKMCIKQMNESRNTNYESGIPIQYMNNQLNDFCKISGSSSTSATTLHFPQHKLKNPSPIWGFQQNLGHNFPISTDHQNWDFTYAMLQDHHKFINSSNSNH